MIKRKIEEIEKQLETQNRKCGIVTVNDKIFHIESLTDSTGKNYLKDVQDFPDLSDLMKFYGIKRNEIILIDVIPA